MHASLNFFISRQPWKVLLFTLLLCLVASGSSWAQIYVRKNASPGGNGSSTSPYQTIQQAYNAASANSTIIIGAGTYREQITITKDGVKFRPENIPAVGTASDVTIDGTDLVNTSWTLVSNGVYKTDISGGTYWRDMYSPRDVQIGGYGNRPDPGTVKIGYGENQLFQNGEMIDNLRWPKNTSSEPVLMPTMAQVLEKTSATAPAGSDLLGRTTVRVEGFDGNQAWVGARIFFNSSHNGFDGIGSVANVLAVGPNSITFDYYSASESTYGIGPADASLGRATELYLFNPPATSSSVTESWIAATLGNGEWYKKGNTLYVKTKDGSAPSPTDGNAKAIYSKSRYFAFVGDGNASNWKVEGFNLFGTSVGTYQNPDNTEEANRSCSGVVFDNLNIKYISHVLTTANAQQGHAGWTGVVLNGNDHTISNSTIRYSSSSAISLQGNRHKALNNKLYDINYMIVNAGVINTGRTGYSYDLEIGNNLISNTTYTGIYTQKLRNSNPETPGIARVHHNTIVDVMRRGADGGALEGGFADLQWARYDHNYIYNTKGHDLLPEFGRTNGIYADYGEYYVTAETPYPNRKIRLIIDHNVVTNYPTPILMNSGKDIKIFNNVSISNGTNKPYDDAIGDAFSGDFKGEGWEVFNNILSTPALTPGLTLAIEKATSNFVTTKDYLTSNPVFVGPSNQLFEGTNRSIENFRLQDNSITEANLIDKGDINRYNESPLPPDLDPIQGLPDIGAFEWGNKSPNGDTTPPTQPGTITVSDLTSRGFTLTWGASTDANNISRYELSNSGNGLSTKVISTGTTYTFTNLPEGASSVTYNFSLIAKDPYGNTSTARTVSVTTPAKTADALISGGSTTPTLDGTRDASYMASLPISKLAPNSTPSNIPTNDIGANWTATWDATNLYIHVAVTDDSRRVVTPNWYEGDNVEIFINASGDRPTSYSPTDFQFFVSPGSNEVRMYQRNPWAGNVPAPAGVVASVVNTNIAQGYNVELKVPFSVLGITPANLKYLGFEVNIGDGDVGETAVPRLVWISEANASPYNFSLAQLTTGSTTTQVAITAPTTNLTVGGTTTLSANQAVNWTSENTNVATVNSSGVVTAVAPGTTTIRARSTTNASNTATVNITVQASTTQVQITAPTTSITVGGSSVTLSANQAVNWTSENTNIATVNSSGVVTAVAAGTATIRARSTANASNTATVNITVQAATTNNYVVLEKWSNIDGTMLSNLDVSRTDNKTTSIITTLESNISDDRYGLRMRGYIVPTQTASYTFFIASDDNGEFRISNGEETTTSVIASIGSWVNSREWNASSQPNQRSQPRQLIAGNRYYFEALMKEGTGGDNLAIGWAINPATPINPSSVAIVGTNGLNIQPYLGGTTPPPTTCSKFASTSTNIIGTSGSWNNSENTRDKAFDGNTSTFFDAPTGNGNWVGLDLGSAQTICKVRYYPRFTFRMVGGKFQGSTTSNFSSGTVTDLATISSEPSQAWTEVAITNTTAFRYVRYLSPDNGYGNVAELEFFTNSTAAARMSAETASSKQPEAFTLQLHPNPANSEVTIDLSGFEGESAVQLKMSDMTGKAFVTKQVQLEGQKQVTLPVSHLPQGLFFVTVQGSKAFKTAKLVITK